MRQSSRQRVLFRDLNDKPVVVQFSAPTESSDGGAVLLAAIDRRLGLTQRLAQAIHDLRQTGKVDHSMQELLGQRVFSIACGYPHGNDADHLALDPVFKLVCGRSPQKSDDRLGSQPTVSRLENSVTKTDLLRMAYALADSVIAQQARRHKPKKVRRITIDLDPTDDPTYGNQQLTFFHGYYDTWCYLPVVVTIRIDDDPEHHVVAAILRPGNASGAQGALAILKRLAARLHETFPYAQLLLRADGAFATPEVLDWAEDEGLEYLINLPVNPVLRERAEPWMKKARRLQASSGQTEHVFGEFFYRTQNTWRRSRRVVLKAEVTVCEGRSPKDNPRFVVTNRQRSPQHEYKVYVGRGEMENRIKELLQGLRFDLTSCTRFLANQFREIITVAAMVLHQNLRRAAAGTELERAQVWTLRERLIKIAVRVVESVRRILLEAPRSYPWLPLWRKIALACGALSG
jgi:phosphohistidine phosphatase SixA